ncbi:hypothetical protein B0H19DRAFT_383989 [Mycena capillaripes]|nr:hypothetical protein B0H19DRAFT_383989 [Mycena capillaripes]
MATTKPTELFRGNGTAEKAHTWLLTLKGAWKHDTDEKDKLYKFENSLHPGGQAEEWWLGLRDGERKSWTALMAAFETKWPRPKATGRAKEVVIRELQNNYLSREVLGKYVLDEDGTSVLAHVAWTEVVRKLLAELPGGDAAMLLMSLVRPTLPIEFRPLIPDTGIDTWEKYLAAVAAVSVDRINDVVEDRKAADNDMLARVMATAKASSAQRAADQRDFATEMAEKLGLTRLLGSPTRSIPSPRGQYTPPAARHSQPTPSISNPGRYLPTPALHPRPYQTPTAAVDQRTPWRSRSSTDTFFDGSTVKQVPSALTKDFMAMQTSPSAGRGRLSSLSGDAIRDVDLARHITQNPRVYTSDVAGNQRYSADMSAWMSQNGNSPAPDYASFPLTPGTVVAGSKECFHCGMLTDPPHFGRAQCMAQNGREVPTREQNIRSLVSGIIHPVGQRTPARVNQIGEVAYDPFGGFDPDQPLYEDADESENGEGPAN